MFIKLTGTGLFSGGCQVCVFLLIGVLAQNVIAQQNGNQTGVTVQLPTLGVSIDSAGVLETKVFPDLNGQLTMLRIQASQGRLSTAVQSKSKLRFVSLRRLETAIADCLDKGLKPDEEMQNLAGLERVQFVFVLPDENDILVAGPAAGWVEDLSGRVVGIESGKPTVGLNDLLTALRVFAPERNLKTWVAISIDPSAEGIQRLNEFKKLIPARISDHQRDQAAFELVNGLRDSLGLASIRVHGIPRTTHLARVMIEADYRMKLIATGLEPPPVRMSTFVGEVTRPLRDMQRWWLTPDYKCVKQADDKLSVELVGRGVQLNTEVLLSNAQGQLWSLDAAGKKKQKPSNAARKYAASFTENYEAISAVRPVFAQLRNAIDLLVISSWILKNDGFQRANWTPNLLLDEDRLPVRDQVDIKHAQCVANAVWKGRVLVLPAGGGVSIQASDAFRDANLIPDEKGSLPVLAKKIQFPGDERWWWD